MDLESTQASPRRSSRKRERTAENLESHVAKSQTYKGPYVVIPAKKRRVVERQDTDSTSAQGGFTTVSQRPTGTSTLTHEDPVPPDCCAVCRRHGGNYAWDCVYEDSSGRCTKCIAQKYKCRPATVEEIAKLDARCSQCKQRGLTTCWYESGNAFCQPCIKRGKQCGAPAKRTANARDRPSLGEPGYQSNTLSDQQVSDGDELVGSANQRLPITPVHSSSEGETKQASTIIERSALREGRKSRNLGPGRKSTTDTHLARTVAKDDGNGITVDRGTSLPNDSLLRGSGGTSGKRRNPALHPMVQEPTPDDSAAEELVSLSADLDMNDDDSADQRLIMESNNAAASSPDPTTEPEAENGNIVHAVSPGPSRSDNESVGLRRRRIPLEDAYSSRPRRNHSRPSYVEYALSDASNQEDVNGSDDDDKDEDEDEDDVWDPPAVEDESEVDEDEDEGEDEELGAAVDSSSEETEDYEAMEIVDDDPELVTASRRNPQPNKLTPGKGIDLSLPPLDNILDITADMASKAIELGIGDVLQALKGRPINVATMCSGTESPLLFLQMLAEALDDMGEPSLHVKHQFSAEIDAVKQAYIERNFHPPILFRDVRQLGDESATTATTAYGSEEHIPGDIDILIAGFVCKDLSALNSKKKTVDDQGETGDTWRAIYHYAKHFQPSIVLLENVKSDKKMWDDVVSRWSKIGYEAGWVYRDTKNHYLPQTRERMYMVAINRKLHGKNVSIAVTQWQSTMEKLQRQCSSPYEAFLANLPVSVIDHSTLSSEPDWSLCKLRYDQIRSEQRLGTRRPITHWNESGTLHPPDYANRKWYDSQSSRVYDAIDVAHLQAAQQEGHDSMYKMKIWDVSQNVDRFKTSKGLTPCITPGGCDFASNLQDALNGSQTLVLQGMPLDKLHFAGETQRERQDLAGNAMSTTVIGASLISAIIHGYKAFRTSPSRNALSPGSQTKPQMQNRLVQSGEMVEHKYCHIDPEEIDIAQFLDEARYSSRLCACEGTQQVSEADIKLCSGCGHTACAICASNPRHQYVDSIPRHVRTRNPDGFVRSWKPRLPSRLELQKFPDLNERLSQLQQEGNENEAYVKRIVEVDMNSQNFSLSEFVRCDNAWKVVYIGNGAKMVLSVKDKVQWLLFVDCMPEEPGNSELRKALEAPIARAIVHGTFLDAEWEMFVPSNQKHAMQLHGSAERSKSWRNLLGLPDHQAETIPARIHIEGDNEEINIIAGDYMHLPHCGTAEASLYKRLTEPVLYLFLDPDPIGEVRDDGFVISVDCSRKQWGESRMIVARLDPAWRPCHMQTVNVVRTGSWMTISTKLAASPLNPTASVLMPGSRLAGLGDSCTDALSVLDAWVPEELRIEKFTDFSWALEQLKTAPSLEVWQAIDAGIQSNCACAPAYPNLMWSVDNAGKATPHEDRKAAATFERGIKTRCPIFHVQPVISKKKTRIEVGVNVVSLSHRAKGRLNRSTNNAKSVNNSWRLISDHTDAGPVRLPKFHLRSNATDALFRGPLSLEYELRGAQPRSLTWMRAQEIGVPLTITEVEEAVHLGLGWRAEARAQTTIDVRGGVLADLPSFGKTVTTIALIQSEFEEMSPEAIVDQNRSASEHLPGLIDTAATLTVCPPHIALQWQTELQLFLGEEQYEKFNVYVIKEFADLKRLTVDNLQQSRVIVVSWTVLAGDDYISELAWVTAMPEPINSSCCAFDAWTDGVSKDLPAQVLNLQTMDLSDFKHATQTLLEQRLRQPEFQATLPVKLQHGSNYQSYESMQAAGQAKGSKSKPFQKRKSSGLNSSIVPLLHLFQFNRIVVDEYHYLNDYKKIKNMLTAVSVKKISAHKRWILSGTPALANFTDIDNIASFLGVRLGRFAVGAGKRTALEDFLVEDQTAVERFLSKTEAMSHQWHQARHVRAQEFLDLFVRQNEASLEHIPCHEELRALELDVAHHAVYLELSKHLISQRMQVKKLKNKAESDRTSRLNASLNHSKTAEDALLKVALIDDTREGDMGLHSLVARRTSQRRDIEKGISGLMRAFEWHRRTGFKDLKPTDPKKAEKEENTIPKLYASFKKDIKKSVWLGDGDATMIARRLLGAAEDNPLAGGLTELKGMSQEKRIKEAKTILSRLRESCTELASQRRSERFIESVQQLLQALYDSAQGLMSCDAEHCQKTATISELYLASQCGHITCKPCIMARGDDENCVVPECSCMVQAVNFIKATDLGTTTTAVAGHSFGRKMHSIVELIKGFPDDDQALVFAPNDEMIAMLGEALDHYDILFYTPSGCKSRQAAKIIEDFKSSAIEAAEDRPKVLLLNLASETAAGVNLTNANHIIFVSPLLVESQYKYDSAMTQAIARSRRYGQEKQVHIYHFAALRTIDVDILEHRSKRTSGITEANLTIRMPVNPLATREKTKLVRNKQGAMALVPVSWLADEDVRERLGVEEEPEQFTSLINFSDTFEDGEE
ncbi:hypothetical protein C7974DRAFT_382135 [Boeremia exigua]|uniref:uncharacterized protein n=1 Tax=Boeremia exigua TaxID=749465 RepID=UPI001E8E5DBD|nr:uncharacterized protein C7974DRAFT_382135 [Boeremia exigua]KAH6643750.1 hypothetical protein C7974DRAFT_382135 [Boeremia exigua]